MSELDDWALEVGYRIKRPSQVGLWFDQHPDRWEQLVEARRRGWSWRRICEFLRSRGFPYTENPMQAEAQRRGVR